VKFVILEITYVGTMNTVYMCSGSVMS